jgi:Sigma-70 factor, region 1.2
MTMARSPVRAPRILPSRWPQVEQSGDLVWDEEESEALRQGRKDAELTTSVDSVRAYLKEIGKVALLNAEQEVDLAKRIEAGLYAAERLRRPKTRPANCPRSCVVICAGSSATASAPRTTYWRPTCA